MDNALTNLLPPGRQRTLAREYLLRVGTLAVALLTILICISAALRVPTYVFLVKAVGAKEMRLASVDSSLAASDGAALIARLESLASDAKVLTNLAEAPSPSSILRGVLAVPRAGVQVSGIAYTPVSSSKPATVVITGKAKDRGALRNYQLALQGDPAVASAALPVSAFAQETDIAFTITLVLASTP